MILFRLFYDFIIRTFLGYLVRWDCKFMYYTFAQVSNSIKTHINKNHGIESDFKISDIFLQTGVRLCFEEMEKYIFIELMKEET